MSLPPPRPAASVLATATTSSDRDTSEARLDSNRSEASSQFAVPKAQDGRPSHVVTDPYISSGNISSLISPYNASFQSASSTASTSRSLPVPPFLASILSSHAAPTPPPQSIKPSSGITSANKPSTGNPSNPNSSSHNTTSGSSTTTGSNSNSTQSPTTAAPVPNPSAALYTLPPAPSFPEDPLIPPENFSLVASGVYRSGFPKKKNFRFLETLKLKTVLTLVLEDYPASNLKWCEEQDVQFMVSLGAAALAGLGWPSSILLQPLQSHVGGKGPMLISAIRDTRQQRAFRQYSRGRHLLGVGRDTGQAESPNPDTLQQGQGE
jgi:hypothetical protein